ncbi:hypothetical protein Tcan_18839 [Toxocara canis]|uniref:Uncharacterized protein n=1 Tax=Toxocara canis TaxID=6265 RepID=A0A0B2UZ65_TOXCA|nr:hypothetical protein Tcan_18839 [Toxocara canis]
MAKMMQMDRNEIDEKNKKAVFIGIPHATTDRCERPPSPATADSYQNLSKRTYHDKATPRLSSPTKRISTTQNKQPPISTNNKARNNPVHKPTSRNVTVRKKGEGNSCTKKSELQRPTSK